MKKTNTGLAEYARSQIGRPYWYGTYGQTATEALYKGKKKQYPSYYTATDFESQYGERVHDCSGLIEGYLMSDTPDSAPKYNSKYDYSANGLRNACNEKGDISTLPEIVGICVFMDGHVGVYIGGGEVIEARGHAYGVVKTKLTERPWKWWGKHPGIEYVKEEANLKTVTVELPQVKKGVKDPAVKTLQRLLNALDYADKNGKLLVIDGDFGNNTDHALRCYQKDNALAVDGIAGEKTWNAILNG